VHSTTESRLRSIPRRVLPALVVLSALWALIVAFTGGFDVHAFGQRLKSTYPDRPAYLTAILATFYICFFRDDARRRALAFAKLAPMFARLERIALLIAIALSVAVFFVGLRQGVLVAEASDAWGYVSQADLWLARDLTSEQPIARNVPWPDAGWTFAPLGYRPAPDDPGVIVPTYPPGLPVLMATGKLLIGTCGPFLISPLLGGLTIWFTYLLGVRVSSRAIGLAAAALLATSPIFLLMVVHPWSDVPATAFLVLGLVLALSGSRWRALWTGTAVSMAIFIRPNLVCVGAVFVAFIVLGAKPNDGETPLRARARALGWFSIGGAPLVLAVAVLNTVLYGAPWNAGHGNLGELYSWRYVWRNVIDYTKWMWGTETPVIALSLVPLIVWTRARRPLLALLTSFIVAVWLSYLFYRAYGEWQYLRFLLPIIPVLLVLASCGVALVLGRLRGTGERNAVAMLVLVCVVSLRAGVIRGQDVLGYWRTALQYTSIGDYVRQHLPANAVILTVQHSGSMRYYANRLTLRWDFLAPAWWPRALGTLSERGYRPYVLLTSSEETAFRSRFHLPTVEDAAGTIVAAFRETEVRLYDPLRLTSTAPAAVPPIQPSPCGCLGRYESLVVNRRCDAETDGTRREIFVVVTQPPPDVHERFAGCSDGGLRRYVGPGEVELPAVDQHVKP
jgi:hypothetical protein